MISRLRYVNASRQWLERNTLLWLRPLVVVGVLLFGVALALKASSYHLILFIIFLAGTSATLFFLHWPPMGLVALIGTIIIPINGPSGVNATMALVAWLLGLWLLDVMVQQRKIRLPDSRPVWSLILLVLTTGLAFGVGQIPTYTFAEPAPLGAQLAGLMIFVLSATAFLLAAYRVSDLRWLKGMTWLLLAIGGLYAVGHLTPELNQMTRRLFDSGVSGSLFITWLLAMSASQALFNPHLHPGWRVVSGGVALAILCIGLFERLSWTSGWLPAVAALVAILCVAKPRLGLPAVLVGLVGAATQSQRFIDLLLVDNQYSLISRQAAWRIVLEIAKVNPILGLGPANYYSYTPLFPLMGWSVQFNSHNQYVDLIAQIGLLGLACFLWFFWEVGRLGWRLREQVPTGFARAYVYGALGGLVGTLVAGALGDWVVPFFYNVGMRGFRASVLGWLFLGGLVALEQMARQPEVRFVPRLTPEEREFHTDSQGV